MSVGEQTVFSARFTFCEFEGDIRRHRMVTPIEMRAFALECLRWTELTRNPSDRQTMLSVARMWMKTASAIEHAIAGGAELALPDLRSKLD